MVGPKDEREPVVERFEATSGRLSGWLTLALSALLVLAGLVYLDEGFPFWVVASGLLVGVLAWASMLRPALWATEEHLVMRNLAETVSIRLDAVEEVAVRQVLAVRVDERRYVSAVVGRTWRKALLSRRPAPGQIASGGPAEGTGKGMSYADWVEARLHELVGHARRGAADRSVSSGVVDREVAVLPLALIAVALLVLVIGFFL